MLKKERTAAGMGKNRLSKRLPDENSEHAFHELESVRDLRPAGRRSSTRKVRRIDTPTLLNAMDGTTRRRTGKPPEAPRTGDPDLPHGSRSRVREDPKAAAVAASQRRLPWR